MSWHHPPRPVVAQCTHLSMTRLHDPDALCTACHLPGPFGWVYKCTQDLEDVIEDAAASGSVVVFDQLGRDMTAQLTVRRRSPAAREDRLSFLDEVCSEQLATYRPDQVAAVLRQRENVHASIQREMIRQNGSMLSHTNGASSAAQAALWARKPWLTEPRDECQYKICPHCRPAAADRAYLSLNAIANGDIPSTAATGYGFHVMGERPVVDAEIVQVMEYRPAAKASRAPRSCADSSSSSDMSAVQLLGSQAFQDKPCRPDDGQTLLRNEGDRPGFLLSTSFMATQGQLKHSPGCDNLAAYADLPGSHSMALQAPPHSSHSRSRQDCVGLQRAARKFHVLRAPYIPANHDTANVKSRWLDPGLVDRDPLFPTSQAAYGLATTPPVPKTQNWND